MKRSGTSIKLVVENDDLTVSISALAALSREAVGSFDAYIAEYRQLLAKVAEEALNANRSGICELCQYYQTCLSILEDNSKHTDEVYQLLRSWPSLVLNYLQMPSDLSARQALLEHLRSPSLELSVSDADAAILTMMLDEDSPEPSENSVAISTDSKINESFLNDFDLDEKGPDERHDEVEPPSLPSLDDYAALLDPLIALQEPLKKLLEITRSTDTTLKEYLSAVDNYSDYLSNFSMASISAGFAGLNQVMRHAKKNLGVLAAMDSIPGPEAVEVLDVMASRIKNYLLEPYALKNSQELVGCLCAGDWPHPLSTEESQELVALFRKYSLPDDDEHSLRSEDDAETEQQIQGPQIATAEDVSLALPEDVEEYLFEIMMEELPEQTAQFSEAVQNLIAGGSMEDVKVAQRMAHSLKGAGNTIGIRGIAELTHHMEDILIEFSKHETLPTQALSLTMMKVVDCLEDMGEALNGHAEPPEDAIAVLQEVLDWEYRIKNEGLPKADDEVDQSSDVDDDSTQTDSIVSSPLSVSAGMQALPDSPLTDELSSTFHGLSDSAEITATSAPAVQSGSQKKDSGSSATVRVSASLVNNLLRLAGETAIMNGQIHERVRQSILKVQKLQNEFNRMHSLGAELEQLIDIKDFSSNQTTLREANSVFDALEMDQYSEIHSATRMLAETAADSQELGRQIKLGLMGLEEMLIDQDQLNAETQDSVMDVRMVPVKTIVSKLQRNVRQTARLTSKQVNLHVKGEDTRIDGDVLNDLADPLMHILRNAIDHGIESAEQRIQSGKDATGTIQLEFHREGNNLVVRCVDDGGGINFDAVRRKAEQLGILQAGQQVSDDELKRILLLSNFSTRDEVTQTSGRGVGMDAVYSKVIEMGGALILESETGVGTQFVIRVPLSLVTSHALLVRQGPSLLAISDHGILQILYVHDGVLEQEGDMVLFCLGDEKYPARFLETILSLPPDRRASDRSKRPVFLVQDEMGISAVIAGEVLDSLSIVVKDFGRYVPTPAGIAGAAILGDGSVKPVIDLPDLLRNARLAAAPMIMVPEVTEAPKPDRAMVMVVDDSRSARYILTKVIEAAGYIVRQAHDGMEALKLLEARPADIVLSDMEMPRMNGLELTEQIRLNSQLSHIPVIMITSRTTRKHREEAENAGVNDYFNKPFDEKGLIESVEALLGDQNAEKAAS